MPTQRPSSIPYTNQPTVSPTSYCNNLIIQAAKSTIKTITSRHIKVEYKLRRKKKIGRGRVTFELQVPKGLTLKSLKVLPTRFGDENLLETQFRQNDDGSSVITVSGIKIEAGKTSRLQFYLDTLSCTYNLSPLVLQGKAFQSIGSSTVTSPHYCSQAAKNVVVSII